MTQKPPDKFVRQTAEKSTLVKAKTAADAHNKYLPPLMEKERKMSESGKVSYFELVIKEPFMKCISDYLLSIFTTIDLCAGVLKNMVSNRMNIFYQIEYEMIFLIYMVTKYYI